MRDLRDLGLIAILILLGMIIYGCHKRRMEIEADIDKPCPVTVITGQPVPKYPALRAYAEAHGGL
jgi:hypothetical protein